MRFMFVLFWLIFSNIAVFRTTNSLSAFCNDENSLNINNWDFIAIRETNCKLPINSAFYHNLIWILGFQLGINFTHFDFLPNMSMFTFTAKDIAGWPKSLFIVAGILLCLIILIVTCAFLLMYQSGWHVVLTYISWAIFFASFTIGMTKIFPKGAHFHHWFNSLAVASFMGHFNILTTAVQGFLMAMFVEGTCRWSLDPVWQKNKKSLNESLSEKLPEWIL